MKILVTGAKGFVGKNLCAQLNNIKDDKARNYCIDVEAVYEYDLDNTLEELDAWCADADFVFNLAGVNRPQNQGEFITGVRRRQEKICSWSMAKRRGQRC